MNYDGRFNLNGRTSAGANNNTIWVGTGQDPCLITIPEFVAQLITGNQMV
jgi:hypothetical protein